MFAFGRKLSLIKKTRENGGLLLRGRHLRRLKFLATKSA